MPLYLVTCLCDEGIRETLFRVFEADSRLDIARAIHRDPSAWEWWLKLSRVWVPSYYEERECPPPEVLLARIDASTIDGDSAWAFRIHEIRTIEKLPPGRDAGPPTSGA